MLSMVIILGIKEQKKIMIKTGLTLGKFAPFHAGHQFIIETALKEIDELIVIIYDTDLTQIPLNMRANWIKTLYPCVTVIQAWNGPVGEGHNREYQIAEETYIKGLLNGKKITHFYSSEFYGEHMSKALNAIDRRVDESRDVVPISGTSIRENAYINRKYISDVVYRDMITKIVFLGAPSTGKSTITQALAKKYKTNFASEYGRDYWEEHQTKRRLPLKAFDEIALGHIQREENETINANKYLFVDTNAISTYMFSIDYHGKAPRLLTKLALENSQRYDLFFLCDTDIPYDDTWDRSGDPKRLVFQNQIIADLKQRQVPYILLSGNLQERIAKVDRILSKFEKFTTRYNERNY